MLLASSGLTIRLLIESSTRSSFVTPSLRFKLSSAPSWLNGTAVVGESKAEVGQGSGQVSRILHRALRAPCGQKSCSRREAQATGRVQKSRWKPHPVPHPCIYPTVRRPAQRAVKTSYRYRCCGCASVWRVGTGRAEEGDDRKTLGGGKGLAWLPRRRSRPETAKIWLISQSPPIMRCEGERAICRRARPSPPRPATILSCGCARAARDGAGGMASPRRAQCTCASRRGRCIWVPPRRDHPCTHSST
jgi:hypothetical protein